MKNIFTQHSQIKVVSNFPELVHQNFQKQINALCWYRNLEGNFKEIVEKLELKENMTEVSLKTLCTLKLSEQGNIARDIIVKDMHLLTEFGAAPSLNLIKNYERDNELDFISTDVYSYHVDRSSIATDTFLCTYYGAASDILPSSQVDKKIDLPEIREKLYDLYDGTEDSFDDFLEEYFFDLHYQAKANAIPINLGLGHLWRLAIDHPKQVVSPCVHRAPFEEGDYRLLLIC